MSALGNLFSDIAGAIREKTGETGTMKPAQFPEKILGIQGGGSADVRYVTFMSYDGTVEYGKKAVAVGDDCADPIKRGVFGTPTRESTAQYNYTFAGWATEINGGLNSDALKAVAEDRTVYANFAAVVRYYTVTFYDGDTVLKTESLAYGAMPDYTPDLKSGYAFEGWEPALGTVAGNVDYHAIWVESISFAGSPWEDISRVCEEGNAAKYFRLGETRTVKISGTNGAVYDVDFVIVGINHDNKEDGTKAGISVLSRAILSPNTIGLTDTPNISKYYNWTNSNHRKNLESVTLQRLPSDLQSYIKPVVKVTQGVVDNYWVAVETTDKLWLPSMSEYGATDTYLRYPDGEKYTLTNYLDGDFVMSTASPYQELNTVYETTSHQQILRTPHGYQSSFAFVLKTNGAPTATGESYCRIGFCI